MTQYITFFFTALLIFAAANTYSQVPAGPGSAPNAEMASDYELTRDTIRGGKLNLDFTQFRHAYLEWRRSECNRAPERGTMVAAFEAKDWPNAIKRGLAVLEFEYGNRGLHLALADAYRNSVNQKSADFHADVAAKLFEGLMTSGDGKTAETAYKVHSDSEEYQVMRELGYEVSLQSLVFVNDLGPFDVLTGTDKKGKTASFYFNIGSFFGGGQSVPCEK